MNDKADTTFAASADKLPTVEPVAAPEQHYIAVIIDAWHREHFTGCATTEQWNHSVKAKEALKVLLTKN